MICPNCKDSFTYSLYCIADDYQDGIIRCQSCDVLIGTFNFIAEWVGE